VVDRISVGREFASRAKHDIEDGLVFAFVCRQPLVGFLREADTRGRV